MTGNTKKWMATSAAAIILVIVAVGVTIAVKYHFVSEGDPAIVKPEKSTLSAESVPLGTPVTVSATFVCPWSRRPIAAQVIPGKGSQTVGEAKIERSKYGWGRSSWTVTAKLQPYHDGEIAAGFLTVTFSDPGKSKGGEQAALPIPSFEATPLNIDDPDSLSLASELSFRQRVGNALRWWGGAAVIIITIVLVIIILRRRRERGRNIILPPWTVALADIRELNENLRKGLISGEFCITKLTDVVRAYLEKRFRLHVQTQTTKEFLSDLEKPGGPLNEDHRNFLKEFLTAADLVKFANFPVDNTLIENTIVKANQLVESTKLDAAASKEFTTVQKARTA